MRTWILKFQLPDLYQSIWSEGFRMLKYVFILLLTILLPAVLVAQSYESKFGKNRVQSKRYDWKVLSYRNTDVYYYGNNKELAELAGTYSEENLISLTDATGYTPFSKIRLIIYGNINEYQESNVAINEPEFVTSGLSTFIKSRVEIAFKGSRTEFENDIKEGIANTLIYTMLYGGTFKEVIQNSYFLSLPDWFISGASKYTAYGWSLEMDNYMRSLALTGKLKDPDNLEGKEAALVGQSIWNYFVIKYGEREFQSLLNFVKVVKNYKVAIESSIGGSYNEFIEGWKNFYFNGENQLKSTYSTYDESASLFTQRQGLITSYGGKSELSLIVASKQNNKFTIRQLSSGKNKTLLKGGKRVLKRSQGEQLPIIRVSQSGVPGVLYYDSKSGGILKLYKGDKDWIEVQIPRLRNITDFAFSPDGNSLILAASNSTNSDLYQYNFRAHKLIQLTNFGNDEVNPRYIPGTNKIVYSSNTLKDSVSGERYFQIHFMDLRTKKVESRFKLKGNCIKPEATSNGVYFLNDGTGIQNLYYYSLADSSISQVSQSLINIEEYCLTNTQGTIPVLMLRNQKSEILALNPGLTAFEVDNVQPETQRSRYLEKIRQKKLSEMIADTLKSLDTSAAISQGQNDPEELVDIRNYKFETEKQLERLGPDFEEIKKKLGSEVYFKGPHKYNNRFTVENIGSEFLIDPLRGLGILLDARMTDILENHKVDIGIFGLFDLKSSNLFGEYKFLKYRTDFGFRYDRQTLNASSNSLTEKYSLNKFQFNAAYPFDISKRIELGQFLTTTTYIPFDDRFFPAQTTLYLGLQGAFVFDNTYVYGLNLRKGFRGRLGFESSISPQAGKDFSKLSVDLRYYQPLIKNISLAGRAFYGQFFGQAPKNFLIGGMDNWLFNRTNRNGPNDPLLLRPYYDNSDLLFLEYVTPLRGFNYNQQFGNRTFLLNAELRVPFANLIYPEEISSAFLKNFEIAGFTDFGAAWTGSSPFSKDNTINTKIIDDKNSNFKAVVNNYKNPYLFGYGFGFRTLMLGAYMKLDVAWGVLDKQVQDAKYYLTFGYDF